MKTVRLQFEVPADKALEIEALMAECGFTKKNEFFNNLRKQLLLTFIRK